MGLHISSEPYVLSGALEAPSSPSGAKTYGEQNKKCKPISKLFWIAQACLQ